MMLQSTRRKVKVREAHSHALLNEKPTGLRLDSWAETDADVALHLLDTSELCVELVVLLLFGLEFTSHS